MYGRHGRHDIRRSRLLMIVKPLDNQTDISLRASDGVGHTETDKKPSCR